MHINYRLWETIVFSWNRSLLRPDASQECWRSVPLLGGGEKVSTANWRCWMPSKKKISVIKFVLRLCSVIDHKSYLYILIHNLMSIFEFRARLGFSYFESRVCLTDWIQCCVHGASSLTDNTCWEKNRENNGKVPPWRCNTGSRDQPTINWFALHKSPTRHDAHSAVLKKQF